MALRPVTSSVCRRVFLVTSSCRRFYSESLQSTSTHNCLLKSKSGTLFSLSHLKSKYRSVRVPHTIMSCSLSTSPPSMYKKVAVCRLMGPNDANLNGNVHGGRILSFIEEAGYIISTEYCNDAPRQNGDEREPSVTQLARVEQTDFLQPMYLGEIAELQAEIIYTSSHSLQVQVTVCANNIIKGEHRITNKAVLWYVPMNIKTGKIALVPYMTFEDPAQEERGRQAYVRQKEERSLAKQTENPHPADDWTISPTAAVEPYTVAYSQTLLSHLVDPSDCNNYGFCSGGAIMKLMDECAGITAAKHCHTNIVTACLNATNFHMKVKKGGLVTLYGRAVFTSSRSIEIEVLVDVEHALDAESPGVKKSSRAVDAFFTFVSLDKDRRTLAIPPLKPCSGEEKKRFEEGRQRYESRKQLRLQQKKISQ